MKFVVFKLYQLSPFVLFVTRQVIFTSIFIYLLYYCYDSLEYGVMRDLAIMTKLLSGTWLWASRHIFYRLSVSSYNFPRDGKYRHSVRLIRRLCNARFYCGLLHKRWIRDKSCCRTSIKHGHCVLTADNNEKLDGEAWWQLVNALWLMYATLSKQRWTLFFKAKLSLILKF